MIALDASALLAFMFRESGHQRVEAVLERSCMSTINVAEVLGRFARDGHDVRQVRGRLEATSIELVPFLLSDACVVAELLPQARRLGLSLGDRACLALAIARGIPAMTADRSWSQVDWGVEVELIR